MKKFLLDTNVISELRKGSRAEPSVVAWTDNHDFREFYISVITLFELEMEVRRKERTDQVQGKMLRQWIDHLREEVFAERILPISARTALINASLNAPDLHHSADSWIAATAIEYNLAVVTRNVKDFHNIEVELINPWLVKRQG